MKNIVCPLSTERFNENVPRVIGLFVVILSIIYVITVFWFIPLFLMFDFYFRGFNNGKNSLLGKFARFLVERLPNSGKLIDKAPKIFAARLGFVFTALIVLFEVLNWQVIAHTTTILLVFFALLECAFNFCVGCIVFTWFVKPNTQG